MTLREGWFITTDNQGDPLVYKLMGGSPYLVEPDELDGGSAIIAALEPGYYTDDLTQVSEEEATAPEEDEK